MKAFDLARAKLGDKVVTDEGYQVEFLKFGVKTIHHGEQNLALVHKDNHEVVCYFDDKGDCISYTLYMAPVKRQAWVNVHYNVNMNTVESGESWPRGAECWPSKQEAINDIYDSLPPYIVVKTILLHEWED